MRYVIVGAGPAGVVAAETLRAQDPAGEVTMIGGEPEPAYSRMAIPYLLANQIDEAGTYLRHDPEHFNRIDVKQIQDRVEFVLNQVGLWHKAEYLPKELSGGQQQRIALARAVANEPFVLLADEPTANLDPKTSGEIIDIIQRINESGTAVILATHKMELVMNSGERYVRMDQGSIVEDWVDPLRGVR